MNKKITNAELENLLNKYSFNWKYFHYERYNKDIICIELKENMEIYLYYQKYKFGASYIVDDFTLRDIKEIIRQYVIADAYKVKKEELRNGHVDCILYGAVLGELEFVEAERFNNEYFEILTDKQKNDILKYRNNVVESVSYLTDIQKEFIKYDIKNENE